MTKPEWDEPLASADWAEKEFKGITRGGADSGNVWVVLEALLARVDKDYIIEVIDLIQWKENTTE